MSKVPVGVTSVTGYGVTAASVIVAALDYVGGDHSAPTRTTLLLGLVAGVSFVTTQVGRYVQAHAQVKYAPAFPDLPAQVEQADWRDEPRTGASDPGDGYEPPEPDIGAINARGEAVYWDEPGPLTDAQALEDPDMGEPLAAVPESYVGDPKDKHGAEDHPV